MNNLKLVTSADFREAGDLVKATKAPEAASLDVTPSNSNVHHLAPRLESNLNLLLFTSFW